MLYQHVIDHCVDIGERGVTKAQLDALLVQLAPGVEALAGRKDAASKALLDLPARADDLSEIETLGKDLRKKFKHIVVAGTGGSGLSGRTLTQLATAGSPSFYYLENIDPEMMEDVLAQVELKKTCFLIISKSGTTAETLSQYYVLLEHVEKMLGNRKLRERFIVITMPGNNPLRQSAAELGLRVLDHDPDIGGRFSILTAVGLLPAAIAGLDIGALRHGALSVIKSLSSHCEPAMGAALQCAFIQKNILLTVMLPYSERLSGFSAWYRQLWAESLGKQGKGSTPIRAVGTTDQHSQLQLYLDGPKDKLFHMITLERAGSGRHINAPASAGLDYLRGKTMGDVMAAEQKATFETLVHNHCPVRLFTLEKLGAMQMGELLMHFMLEVILVAKILNVNPFDQPAVEEGKKLARDYLSTKDYQMTVKR